MTPGEFGVDAGIGSAERTHVGHEVVRIREGGEVWSARWVRVDHVERFLADEVCHPFEYRRGDGTDVGIHRSDIGNVVF